jgi:hypothetical protein
MIIYEASKNAERKQYIASSHKEEWNYAVWRKMDGIEDHHVKQNEPDPERQIPYI